MLDFGLNLGGCFFGVVFFWRFGFVPYFALACLTEILGLYGSCTFFFCLLWAFDVTLKYFSSYLGPHT